MIHPTLGRLTNGRDSRGYVEADTAGRVLGGVIESTADWLQSTVRGLFAAVGGLLQIPEEAADATDAALDPAIWLALLWQLISDKPDLDLLDDPRAGGRD
jgi:hypothetical protein